MSRATTSRTALVALACAWSAIVAAGAPEAEPPLVRLRIAAADPPATARELEREGFDVLEGSPGEGALEVVASAADAERLAARGFSTELLEVGRPLAEVLAAVPAGYLDLAAIVARLQATAAAFPGIARVVDLTTEYGLAPSAEGRALVALKISDDVGRREDEPAVLIVANHHAREIVTPVLALDAIDQLTAGYASDPRIRALVDGHEVFVAPVWNPDGYEHVFRVDNLWRKNRRVFGTGIGVDLNRNYPQGWNAPCDGSGNPASGTYKGPSAASEAETTTMIAWSTDLHFAKVLDYHSSGRETLWAYNCLAYPWDAYLRAEASALSSASGYGGQERRPSSEGEHQEWQMARIAGLAFLTETATEFQPPHAEALTEAALVWPGVLHLLERPVPLSGHVTDACSGAPLVATISYPAVAFANGETNQSFLPFGRYHAFLPGGAHEVDFSAPGYAAERHTVSVAAQTSTVLEVALVPLGGCGGCAAGALTPRRGLIGAKDGAGGAAFRWEGEAGASEYHLNSVADKTLLPGDGPRQAPRGSGALECRDALPACTDDDAVAGAPRLYEALSACGPGAADEGPAN